MTCAGKTGTTSENYDLWFCGMTPYYTASIWMGYDSNVDMGGQNTHKYMWRDIMDQIVELEGQDTSADFDVRRESRQSASARSPDCFRVKAVQPLRIIMHRQIFHHSDAVT